MTIIQTDILEQKINTFIEENHITLLKKDSTETFQKRTQQALQTRNLLIERDRLKYLIDIKPKAPNINAYIKTQKGGAQIRPVINSRHAPSYNTAELLNKNQMYTICRQTQLNTRWYANLQKRKSKKLHVSATKFGHHQVV